LERFRQENAAGIDYQGKHYTGYEATQMQRRVERTIRAQRRRILVDEATGSDSLQTDQIRLVRLNDEYARFSKAAGLRTQTERLEVSGFGPKQETGAISGYKSVAIKANSMYDIGSEDQNIDAYMRDLPLRAEIQSGTIPLNILPGQQRKHIVGTLEYDQYVKKLGKIGQHGPSRLSITQDEAQELVNQYHGIGILHRDGRGTWTGEEWITIHPEEIGVAVNNITGAEAPTTTFKIHYGKKGAHIVPDYPSKKGMKGSK